MQPPQDAYFVVTNDEEQFSLWPSHMSLPLGWRSLGEAQPRAACLEAIEKVWTDLRPLGLRRHLAQA